MPGQLYMEPLKRGPKIRKFVVFDLESKDDDTQGKGFTRPFLAGVYDGERYYGFRNDPHLSRLPWYERSTARGGCIDKMMRWMLGENDDGRIDNRYKNHDAYAHNMGAFDGLFLPAWLQANNDRWSFKLQPVQSRIMAFELWKFRQGRPRVTPRQRRESDSSDRKSYGILRILDSFKVLPVSLDKVIKMFKLNESGVGKFEMDLDADEHDPRWEEYNADDCKKLWQAMQKYQDLIRNMGGDVGVTAPATAMKLLRMKYLREDIKIHRNVHFIECKWGYTEQAQAALDDGEEPCTGCAHAFFRSAYAGGRTEIYTREGKNLTYYDINSSYPASMKKPQPIGRMTVLGENDPFVDIVRRNTHVGFVSCTVSIPRDLYLPPLPLRMDGKLKFPVGTFSGTWDWCELALLTEIGGRILHVEKSVWIEAESFMSEFVDALYAMRDKNSPDYDEGRSETAKIMVNSTFGKFGMEPDRLDVIILKPGERATRDTRAPTESRSVAAKRMHGDESLHLPKLDMASSAIFEHASLVRYRDIRVDASYIIPQIAAHITALSRVRLWSFSMDVLGRGKKLYYSDTDSLITDDDKMPSGSKLGEFKKEFGDEKIDIVCYAPKMYWVAKSDPKATPFAGEHIKDEKDQRVCEKSCKGCARFKIMMKGVPRDMKTLKTLKALVTGKEISFKQHEKLGALARRDLKDTPRMVDVKKSMRTKYDKRILTGEILWQDEKQPPKGGETRSIIIGHDVDDEPFTSERWRHLRASAYTRPQWLNEVLR